MIDVVEAVGRRLGAQRPEWLDTVEPPRLGDAGRFDAGAGLDDLDLAVLAITGAIEDDIRFGSAFAQLQQPLAARRPCVGLVGWLLADEKADTAEVHRRCHALVDRGLLNVDNPTDPRAEWVLRPPVAVWDALTGGDSGSVTLPEGLERRPATSFPDLAQLVLTPEQHALAQRLPDLVATGEVSALVVRGMRGTGRLTLLGAVARELGRDVLLLDAGPAGGGEHGAASPQREEAWRLLAPLAELTHALPVVRLTAGPGAVAPLRAMPGLATALGVTLGRTGAVDGAPLARALTVELDGCRPEQRYALWQASPVPVATADLERIAVSFVLPPGTIHRLRPLAGSAAVAAGRRQITVADVRAGCQVLSRQSLETHATRLEPLPADVTPVLAPLAAAELDALVTRCRRREDLGTALGSAVGMVNRGVRALFSGPSGTGKTLAARTVAARLGLDVHRLDLAAVVNKYIGETERNLDEVLSRAEELGVVLLLDEGDALMTRRTDVGNANDRYANLETNFLLQRLETFEGIAIVTTNAGNRIDTAFLRRIDVTVDFAPPDAQQRLELWQLHLPSGHRVHADELADLARRCALTGGQIRNAVLHAALLALDRGTPIGDDDVVAAVRREYRRDGAAAPLR